MEILKGYERICLYCGKQKKTEYDDYEPYYVCDCPDALKVRSIEEQITKLRNSIPRPKFKIEIKNVLTKIEEE